MFYEIEFIQTLRPNRKEARYPAEDLSEPIDGVYLENLSPVVRVFVNFDARASGTDQDAVLEPDEWRTFHVRVRRYVSVWSNAPAEVRAFGYHRIRGEPAAEVRGVLQGRF